jgi:putative FmdB family regulatory protein
MPLYEYRCGDCRKRFEALVHSGQKPACAHCGSRKLEKLISVFAVAGGSSAPSFEAACDDGGGACGMPERGCGAGACGTDWDD